jgi:hypothetical protein
VGAFESLFAPVEGGSPTGDPDGTPAFAFFAQLHLLPGTQLQAADVGAIRLVAPDGSWCGIANSPSGSGHYHVSEGGPRSLWDVFEHAHEHYTALGRPQWERFGVTATPTEQHVWLDSPDNDLIWPIPVTESP